MTDSEWVWLTEFIQNLHKIITMCGCRHEYSLTSVCLQMFVCVTAFKAPFCIQSMSPSPKHINAWTERPESILGNEWQNKRESCRSPLAY